jgi:RNA polymerase sigma-70 factor (ECF subfamily)
MGSVEGRPLEDDELVERARGGDIRAYEELVARYREIAFRTAFLITRSAAEAEDAAQDAFVKTYFGLPRFRTGASFRPWLLRIVANESKNRRRSAGRREGLGLRLAAEPSSGDAAPSPEVAAIERDRAEALLAALAGLHEKDQIVIGCRYFLELTEAETSETLGIRPGTVKSRLSRALDHLRAARPEGMEAEHAEAADG